MFQMHPRQELFLYRFLRDSSTATLEQLGLVQRLEIRAVATVQTLLSMITDNLRTCPFQYIFAPPRFATRSGTLLQHEQNSVKVLEFVDQAKPRPRDHQIRLRPSPVATSMSVEDLIFSKLHVVPSLSVEGNRVMLHFGQLSKVFFSPCLQLLTLITECIVIGQAPLSGIMDNRRHTCMSKIFYRAFPSDDENMPDVDSDDEASSGGEELDDSSAEDPPRTPSPPVQPPASTQPIETQVLPVQPPASTQPIRTRSPPSAQPPVAVGSVIPPNTMSVSADLSLIYLSRLIANL